MGTGMKIMTSIAIWIAGIVDGLYKRASRRIQFVYLSPFGQVSNNRKILDDSQLLITKSASKV